MADRKNARNGRGKSPPYWKIGPGSGATVEGMKTQEELDSWAPAIAHVSPRRLLGSASKTVLRVLEICSGCCSVSAAARKEALENFVIDEVEVFSVDGKPSTNATRVVDILTYDWENDELLNKFRHEGED